MAFNPFYIRNGTPKTYICTKSLKVLEKMGIGNSKPQKYETIYSYSWSTGCDGRLKYRESSILQVLFKIISNEFFSIDGIKGSFQWLVA